MNERQTHVEPSKDVPYAIRGGASFVLLLSMDRPPEESGTGRYGIFLSAAANV